MQYKTELSRENHDNYVVIRGIVDGGEWGCDDYEMSHAETLDGQYIGNPDFAKQICDERGIAPELAKPSHNVCSIGFCSKDNKWYGWSHRAMYGFTIGSEVHRGDCAYVPVDIEDARLDAIRFWDDDNHLNTDASLSKDEDGKICFDVIWTYADDPELVPNEKLRGQQGGCRSYPPEQFGNGEWQAKTMADAKQMAIDFAEGVS